MFRFLKSARARTVIAMRAHYFILSGTIFISAQYLTIFLRSFEFVDDFRLGFIVSAGSLAAALAQMTFGRAADKAKVKNHVLLIAVGGVATCQLLLVLPGHARLLSLLPCVFLLQAFNAVPFMLSDTIAIESVERLYVSFGTIRCFASIGAAFTAFLLYFASLWTDMDISAIYYISASMALVAFIPASSFPVAKGHAYGIRRDKRKSPLRVILRNRRMALLLGYLLLLFIGIQATGVYMGIYVTTEAGFNAGIGVFGLIFAIFISVEAAVMTFGSRLIQSMNIYHVFYLSAAAAVLRSLIWFLAPNIPTLMLNAFAQALMLAPLWTRLGPYVYTIVDKELRTTANAYCSIMCGGAAPMVGSALAGVIASRHGVRGVFGFMAAMITVVAIVFIFLFERERAYFRAHPEGGLAP